MKISLDSNVFADQDFIEWLIINNTEFEIVISVIVALETYHWYNIRKLSRTLFENDISELNATIYDLNLSEIFTISDLAKNSSLRFKHHARDFIIGGQASTIDSILITSNIKHFTWLDKVMTPEDLVLQIQ